MDANFISAKYQPSVRTRIDANAKVMRRYMREGYERHSIRDGYYVLEKPSQALVTIAFGDSTKEVNMQSAICEYYEQEYLTSELVERFCADAKAEKIKLEWDPARNYCFIVKA